MPCSRFGIVLLALAIGMHASTTAQNVKKPNAPAPILAAFHKAYPNATIKAVSREKRDGKTIYELESVDGSTNRDLLYDPSGNVLETEEGMDLARLPAVIQDAIKAKYLQMSVKSCERLTRGTVILYELGLKVGKKSVEVVFDEAGKELSKK
jgi:uncharacterized membrane protein YkoI